jgi:ferritin
MRLDPAVLALLNRQINAEQYASLFYSGVASWADNNAYPGLAKWATDSAIEEFTHAQRFIDYANDRGVATIAAIANPPQTFDGYGDALMAALSVEQSVSQNLTDLITAANGANDAATALIASRQLLDEQVSAEKFLAAAILKVARSTDLDLLDGELYE